MKDSFYKVQIIFSDKKLLKTVVKTNNIGRTIEALINKRIDTEALAIKVIKISEAEATKQTEDNQETKADAEER